MASIRKALSDALHIALWLVAMLTLLQILFGASFVSFFGMDVVGNIGVLAQKFGNAGLVGVLAAALVAWLIVRDRNSSSGPDA
ncbi:MAG: hypothetical protein VYA17_00160 [Pseudomonadota bacterium]|nr:hypothetical protein [Pseudomonadota bacterium]